MATILNIARPDPALTPTPLLCLPPPSMRPGIVSGNLEANASGPLTCAL